MLNQLTAHDILNAKIECFKRRIFDFITDRDGKSHVKQKEALNVLTDTETEEQFYGGAAGGAKSWTGCAWLGFSCLLYPGTKWFIGRNELKRITESTLITFYKVAKEYGFTHRFKFNGQKNYILFDNGSRIDLLELKFLPSDPLFERFGSTEYTGGWIEEGGEVKFGAYEILKTRIGRHLNDHYDLIAKLFVTLNPKKNWVYSKIYKLYKESRLPRVIKFLQALVTENPFIESGYIERLNRLSNKNQKERLRYGNWEYDDDPSTLIDYESISDYWNPPNLKGEGKKYLTVDVARKGRDNTVFRVWLGWLCIERKSMAISKVNEVVDEAKKMMQKHQIPKSRTIADEDGVGGGVVDYLDCEGFVNNSRPLNGENYDNLKSQCSFGMAKKIVDREAGEISENPDVEERTSEEMEQVKEKNIDKDGKKAIVGKDVMKEKLGRSPDEWDSIMMRYYFEIAPKPMKLTRSKLL